MNKKRPQGAPQRPVIGIYCRKSTDRQELSLQAQERLCRQFLEHIGKSDTETVLFRDICSGRKTDRRGYQDMFARARSGQITALVFHRINRFGRDAAEGLAAISELRRLRIEVMVVDQPNLDIYKPEGMLLFTFLLGQGQFEVENLATETAKGMKEKILQGGWPFRAPDGYRNQRQHLPGGRSLAEIEVDTHRAAIVRLIFMLYSHRGFTLQQLADHLNRLHERRIARGKSGCLRRSGKSWYPQSIYRILRNEFYRGYINVKSWQLSIAGIHQPIISARLFVRVQELLDARGSRTSARQQHIYLLQDHLYLERPDLAHPAPMYATTVKRRTHEYRYYYVYDGRKRHYVSATRIEAQVIDTLRNSIHSLGPDPQLTLRQRVTVGAGEFQRVAQERLETVLTERQRLIYFASKARISEHEFSAVMQRLFADEQAARTELAQAEIIKHNYTSHLDAAVQAIDKLRNWQNLTTDEQRAVLQVMVSAVYTDDEQHIRLAWQPLWEMLWLDNSPEEP
jgi:DNA invertase Pin-like site-specific DNA recombinase